jgi:hypothetical protein
VSGTAGVQDRSAPVDPWGRYYTPQAVADRLVALLPEMDPGLVVEPSAGAGAFVRAVAARWPRARIDACEPDPTAALDSYAGLVDCLHTVRFEDAYPDEALDRDTGPDLVIGNPPYEHAEAHIVRALRLVREGGRVAYLLRLGILEGVGRQERLWSRYPPEHVHALVRRPRFEGPGGKVGRSWVTE